MERKVLGAKGDNKRTRSVLDAPRYNKVVYKTAMRSRTEPDWRGAVSGACHEDLAAICAGHCSASADEFGDPRMSGHRAWGATRGGPCSIRGKASIRWRRGCGRPRMGDEQTG